MKIPPEIPEEARAESAAAFIRLRVLQAHESLRILKMRGYVHCRDFLDI